MNVDCYENIIGLSQTECTCYESGKPEDFDTSLSGLYLDELEPLNNIEGFDDCQAGNIWELMEKARSQAVRTFIADTNALLLRHYKLLRHNWKGTIGEGVAKENDTLSTTYAGMRVNCAPIRSGSMIIKKIGTLFTTTGTITVKVYNGLNTLVATRTLNTTANVHNVNDIEDITLDLAVDYSRSTDYFFVYTVGSMVPRANRVSCGCGSFKGYLNTQKPTYYDTSKKGTNGWGNWVMVGGHTCDDLESFHLAGITASNYIHGLTLEVEFRCNLGDTLCQDTPDFDADPLALSMAFAIRYKAADVLAESLLLSDRLSRVNMINKEMLSDKRKEWTQKYIEHVNYIVEHANVEKSECLTCDSIFQMKRSEILS